MVVGENAANLTVLLDPSRPIVLIPFERTILIAVATVLCLIVQPDVLANFALINRLSCLVILS